MVCNGTGRTSDCMAGAGTCTWRHAQNKFKFKYKFARDLPCGNHKSASNDWIMVWIESEPPGNWAHSPFTTDYKFRLGARLSIANLFQHPHTHLGTNSRTPWQPWTGHDFCILARFILCFIFISQTLRADLQICSAQALVYSRVVHKGFPDFYFALSYTKSHRSPPASAVW